MGTWGVGGWGGGGWGVGGTSLPNKTKGVRTEIGLHIYGPHL